MSLSVLIKCNV